MANAMGAVAEVITEGMAAVAVVEIEGMVVIEMEVEIGLAMTAEIGQKLVEAMMVESQTGGAIEDVEKTTTMTKMMDIVDEIREAKQELEGRRPESQGMEGLAEETMTTQEMMI